MQIGEYITPLLSRARGLKNPELYLQATAASFVQSWRLVATLLDIGHVVSPAAQNPGASSGPPNSPAHRRKSLAPSVEAADPASAVLTCTQAEDVMYV